MLARCLAVTAILAAAPARAQPGECTDEVRLALDVESGLACTALGGGAVLAVAVGAEDFDDDYRRSVRLTWGLVGPGERVVRGETELTAVAARRELPPVLGYLDDVRFLPAFGSIHRLSAVWQTGEDEATRTEIQWWLRVRGARVTSLWAGRASGLENSFDQCVTTRVVDLRVEGATVVRRWTVETTFTDQGIHEVIPVEERRRACGPGVRRVGPTRSPMHPRRLTPIGGEREIDN